MAKLAGSKIDGKSQRIVNIRYWGSNSDQASGSGPSLQLIIRLGRYRFLGNRWLGCSLNL
jgi:hypothetical protein